MVRSCEEDPSSVIERQNQICWAPPWCRPQLQTPECYQGCCGYMRLQTTELLEDCIGLARSASRYFTISALTTACCCSCSCLLSRIPSRSAAIFCMHRFTPSPVLADTAYVSSPLSW